MKYLLVALLLVAAASILYYVRSNAINTSGVEEQQVTNSETKDNTVSPTPRIGENNSMQKQLKKPDLTIDKTASYVATLKTTEGDIEVELNAKDTPVTANNFVYLAQNHFYDNTIFHRVINGFMIQGGDPTGTGAGGPGYRFDDEPFTGEYERGTVAMANAGPNTNGSQFFIMHKANPLPKNYVIFGKVTKGIEVVDNIATAQVMQSDMGELSKPVNPVHILSVTITKQ